MPSNSAQDFHILRLGWHDRANALPLLYPLTMGWVAPDPPWQLHTVRAAPRALLEALLSGSLDAAFIAPVGLAQYDKQLTPVNGWALACEGASATALLLAPRRLDMMHEGYASVSPEAHGSTAEHLLRVLLKPYYDITLRLNLPGEPGYGDPAGARLLYADGASREARARPQGWVAEDMGVAWYVLTGMPVIWELLAAPRDVDQRRPGATTALHTLLERSHRAARDQHRAILTEGAHRLGLHPQVVGDLFSRQRYIMGQAEHRALAHLLDLAGRVGLLDSPPPISLP